MQTVFTIGYEGRTSDDFLGTLQANEVTRVVDVRELPLSRRKGFSKTALREALEAAGIEYIHLRSAGNPYRKMRQDIEACLASYGSYLDESQEVVPLVADTLEGHRAALLCFEADAECCHRSVLADRLLERAPRCEVVNL